MNLITGFGWPAFHPTLLISALDHMPSNFSRNTSVLVLASILALSGCSKESGAAKTQTQVAAKVNKEEISVHQINNVLAKTANITADQAKEASRQILEKLIDQQLLVEQAQDKKLDRDPNILQQLEAARHEILARAYVEQLSGAVSKPSAEEVKEYYGKHPELFSERRIFNLNEITIQNRDGLKSELQEQMGKAKSLNDIAEWLKQKNIPFNAANATKPAEQLPIEILPRLHQMKDGQIGMLPMPGGIVIMQLAASRTVAIDEKTALPLIEQFLQNQRKVELVNKEVKQLRDKAKIEYTGEFSAPPAVAPVAAPVAPTATTASKSADQMVIDKGLSSIK